MPIQTMPIASSKIPIISCLPVSPNRTMTPNYTGSRSVRLSTSPSPALFYPIPQLYRMAKHDAPPAQSFLPFTISKIRKIATKTLVFLYFRISVCAPKVATVSNSVSLKSSGMSLPSSPLQSPYLIYAHSNTVRHCKSIYSAAFYVYTAKKFPGMEGWLSLT